MWKTFTGHIAFVHLTGLLVTLSHPGCSADPPAACRTCAGHPSSTYSFLGCCCHLHQSVPLEEQLEALGRAVAAGKVRAVGMSNETPWGLLKALNLGESRL
jgi:hypothetical protein